MDVTYYYLVEWKRDDTDWTPSTVFVGGLEVVALFTDYHEANKYLAKKAPEMPTNHYRQRAIQLPPRE